MELSTPVLFMAIGASILFIIAQAIVSFSLITKDAMLLSHTRAKRHDLRNLAGKLVHFKSKGQDFYFPTKDISMTGMSFYSEDLPEGLALDGKLNLDIQGEDGVAQSVNADVVYVNLGQEDSKMQVGLKFEKKIDQSFLNSYIQGEEAVSANHLSLAA